MLLMTVYHNIENQLFFEGIDINIFVCLNYVVALWIKQQNMTENVV